MLSFFLFCIIITYYCHYYYHHYWFFFFFVCLFFVCFLFVLFVFLFFLVLLVYLFVCVCLFVWFFVCLLVSFFLSFDNYFSCSILILQHVVFLYWPSLTLSSYVYLSILSLWSLYVFLLLSKILKPLGCSSFFIICGFQYDIIPRLIKLSTFCHVEDLIFHVEFLIAAEFLSRASAINF